jgi:hypothetical protein
MDPILRSMQRMMQTQLSMACKFTLRQLCRYSLKHSEMCNLKLILRRTLPWFTLPPHGNLRMYNVFLNKLNFTSAAHHLLKTVKTQAGRDPVFLSS